ncbi:MAG: phosphate propanoyltransferase [Phycisphaerae bacterium]|nr:phosphate propanoyltransferase [Phycisphaerae bacterium]
MDSEGIKSYCQDCGACSTDNNIDRVINNFDSNLIDAIAEEVSRTLQAEAGMVSTKLQAPLIPLGVSNRHLHLRKDTFEMLFGFGTEFEVYRDLFEPGEFASKHSVTIVGAKMRPIQNVRILGPFRDYDQVEVSLSDAINLGINPPIGDLSKGAPLTLIGPKGSIYREHIAIIANRHVHMSPRDAEQYGVKDGDYCKIRIPGIKPVVLENVLIRTNQSWKLMLHLDTDDANAAHVRCDTEVEFYGKM